MSRQEKIRFAELIIMLSEEISFSTSSWIRTPMYNSLPRIGGKPNSRHLDGVAIDVVLDDHVHDFARFKARCNEEGLVVVDEDDHLHVQVPRYPIVKGGA